MASETPVPLKKKKKHYKQLKETNTCIIHSPDLKNYGDVTLLTETGWNKIQDVKSRRLQCDEPRYRLTSICDQIPDVPNFDRHGYHRACYQNFTNLKYLKRKIDSAEPSSSSIPLKKRRESTTGGSLFSKNICIICNKGNRIKNRLREKLTKCVTESAKNSLREAALRKSDARLVSMTDNFCLIAKEAHYHDSCRKEYTRREDRHDDRKGDSDKATEREEAHRKSFSFLCDYVERHIIEEFNVERMTMLKERYCLFLQENFPEFHNPHYKTDKLKDKLQKAFGHRLSFWQPNYRSDLVYCSDVKGGSAVEAAFESASSQQRRIEEAALTLRRIILEAFKTREHIQWPPTADELVNSINSSPPMLSHFLTCLLHKKTSDPPSERCVRLVNSISQDLCYSVTNGKWKLPKQLLLGMTVRHLSGNAHIITLLNRFGHSVSNSVLLELETAMCDKVTESDSCLPKSINKTTDGILHFCWDNFDLNEETLTGTGTTHSTHGIVIQEPGTESSESDSIPQPSTSTEDVSIVSSTTKPKKRSATYRPQQLQPCFVKPRSEPNVYIAKTASQAVIAEAAAMKSDFLWFFMRTNFHSKFPHWKGWLCLTSENSDGKSKSTIEYMPPINATINENSTIQNIIEISQNATNEVSQEVTFITFDLAVAKKAYNILWQRSDLYRNVFVHLGAFHTTLSYLSALGKLMKGSGFDDIVVEAGICANGSIEAVLKGKHYNRAIRVHCAMLEALERLLFLSFEQNKRMTKQIQEAKATASQINSDPCKHDNVISSDEFSELFSQYVHFKEEIRAGSYGRTPQFWIQYMDNVWILLRFLRAIKTNDLDLYIMCLQQLCPLLFTMDHQNYARYLTLYCVSLLNISDFHPDAEDLLRKGGLSVNRSPFPNSRAPIDLTIEQTINRHAKTKGGIVGFSKNCPAYYRWCVTRHSRASYVSATDAIASVSESNICPKDISPSNNILSEKLVEKVISAVRGFINPFEVDGALICLSSGHAVPDNVAAKLVTVQQQGEKEFNTFVERRLQAKSTSFHDPIKKKKLITFGTLNNQKCKKSVEAKNFQITAQRNLFGQLLMVSQENNVDLAKVMMYPLNPFPWSLATSDGSLMKTNKAVLLHKLEGDNAISSRQPEISDTYVIDGNALLQSLVGLPDTFGELALKVFMCLPTTNIVHFVTDRYDASSIKDVERLRRGQDDSNTYIIGGPSTKVPRDWKSFLSSSNNKTSVVGLLLSEWENDTYASRLQGRMLYFSFKESCTLLSSEDGIITDSQPVQSLSSSQEEADTKIILHCLYSSMDSKCTTIVVRSPDTDVFLLLLAYVNKIKKHLIFDTGTGNNRRQIDISIVKDKLSPNVCNALIGLHSFTGCDTVSSFTGKGKIKPFSIMCNDLELVTCFEKLGTQEELEDTLVRELQNFVCRLYGYPSATGVDDVRLKIVKKRFTPGDDRPLAQCHGMDLSLLPPCERSLLNHIKRANYQTMIWRRASQAHPQLPCPEDNGWKRSDSGQLQINWCDGDMFPNEIVDILSEEENTTHDSDEESVASDIEWLSESEDDITDSETESS